MQANSLPAERQGKTKNTGMGSLSFCQWTFLTQESNQSLLHCSQILYQLSYQGSPNYGVVVIILLLQRRKNNRALKYLELVVTTVNNKAEIKIKFLFQGPGSSSPQLTHSCKKLLAKIYCYLIGFFSQIQREFMDYFF